MVYFKKYIFKLISKYLLLIVITTTVTFSYSQRKVINDLKLELSYYRSQVNFKQQDTTHIILLNKLAFNYRFYKPDSLYLFAKEALDYSTLKGYSRGIIEASLNLGEYHLDKGEAEVSINYYQEALKLSKKEVKTKLHIILHSNLAEAYTMLNKFGLALTENLKALELVKQTNYIRLKSRITRAIAILYLEQNDYEQTLNYYLKEKELLIGSDYEFQKAQNLINLGELYNYLKQFDLAEQSINTSISVFEKNQNYDWQAFAYKTKGDYFLKQKMYVESLDWYKKSKSLYDEKVKDEKEEIFLIIRKYS